MKSVTFDILVEREQESESLYIASCGSVPGCYSIGHTPEEASSRMAQAMELHFAELLEDSKPVPVDFLAGRGLVMDRISFNLPVCQSD